MRLRYIIFSWDFILALIILLITVVLLAPSVTNNLSKDLYSVGISVLSIMFSVYFAALAIIISSSDDDFIYFLEEVGDYNRLIATFHFSLATLFVALVYSIIMYISTSILINDHVLTQPKWLLAGFGFIFFYSLFAASATTMDAIRYARARADFLKMRKQYNRTDTQDRPT